MLHALRLAVSCAGTQNQEIPHVLALLERIRVQCIFWVRWHPVLLFGHCVAVVLALLRCLTICCIYFILFAMDGLTAEMNSGSNNVF